MYVCTDRHMSQCVSVCVWLAMPTLCAQAQRAKLLSYQCCITLLGKLSLVLLDSSHTLSIVILYDNIITIRSIIKVRSSRCFVT